MLMCIQAALVGCAVRTDTLKRIFTYYLDCN
jgi:hypothetical protein